AVFAAVVGGLTLFRFVYYGSPVPNTYQLKMAGWPLLPRLRHGWRFVLPFLDASRTLTLLALGSVALQRDGRRLLLLCFAGSVFACQIWGGGDAWSYWRMLVPAAIALIVLAAGAISYLAGLVARAGRRSLTLAFSLAGGVCVLWAADQPFLGELRMETPAY